MQIVPSSNSAFLAFGTANNAPTGILLNPDFNTGPVNGTSWMCSGNATISNGQAVWPGGGGGGFFYESNGRFLSAPVVGANYVLNFYINAGSTGSLRAVLNNTSLLDVTVTGSGVHSLPFTYSGGDPTLNFHDQLNNFSGSLEWAQISPA